eukprot:855058-Amphidinium_carterae.1
MMTQSLICRMANAGKTTVQASPASFTGLEQVPLFVSGLVDAKESQYLQQCQDGEDNLPEANMSKQWVTAK